MTYKPGFKVIDEVRTALATYHDWAESNTEAKFAQDINRSFSSVHRAFRLLVQAGEVEKVSHRLAPRVTRNIYRLTSAQPVDPMRDCVVAQTDVGWWVTFPHDPRAGILVEGDSAKMQFAKSCEVDLADRDLLLALDLGEITRCPEEYYHLAKNFRETTF